MVEKGKIIELTKMKNILASEAEFSHHKFPSVDITSVRLQIAGKAEKYVMLTWLKRRQFKEFLSSSMWLIPTAFIIGAIALSFLLPWIDKQISAEPPFVFSASSALATLSAIAAGMITLTGFVFTILIFATQFQSSAYTTRLIQMITTFTFTKVTTGFFVATFIYALFIIAQLATDDTNDVPQYSVNFAAVLLIISNLLFFRLIAVVTYNLPTGRVVDKVGEQGRKIFHAAYPYPAVSPEQSAALYRPDESTARSVKNNRKGGILQAFDIEGIITLASESRAVIELLPAVGEYVPTGATIFRVYEEEKLVDERLLLDSIALGYERSLQEDLEYPLRILVDIAIKALSPGINDPTTAVQALDQIADLIMMLGRRQLSDGIFRDSQGKVRLIYVTPTWEEYLSLAITEIRVYGADSPQIAKRLKTLLMRTKAIVPEWRIPVIDEQIKLLEDAIASSSGK